MISALNKQADGTIELTITIPVEVVKKTWEEVVGELAKNLTLPGFRKGKAPRKLVEKQLDTEKIKEEVLKKLLPQGYTEAVQKHNLRPIINPRIHLEKINPEPVEGWQFTALTCEAPEVELDNYKESIQKVTAKTKIVLPGKEPEQVKFEDIVKALLEDVRIEIPKILLEIEVEKLLAQTLDEIKRLGLTLDQYLASTGRTAEGLRKESKEKAEKDLKLEFILQEIAQVEKITVTEKEIEEAIQKGKTDQEKKNLENNRYLLAAILRQQKTLDFLRNL